MPRKAVTTGNKLVALNLKVPPHVRAVLEAKASESGRSLTAEVSFQLEMALTGNRPIPVRAPNYPTLRDRLSQEYGLVIEKAIREGSSIDDAIRDHITRDTAAAIDSLLKPKRKSVRRSS